MSQLKPRLLILSFSRIESDARVLKQVRAFADTYSVTTCGYGEAPAGVADHVRVPDGATAVKPYSRLLRWRLYRLAYWRQAGPRAALAALRGRHWQAVIANDPESLPLALRLADAALVHSDLHEYSPRMREHWPVWKRLYAPYYAWLIRRFAAKAASVTTVSQGIADEYRRVFGIDARLVTNAAPFADREPTPTGNPLRIVHSGGAMPHRGLEEAIDAIALSKGRATLDLYLVGEPGEYLESLRRRADAVEGVTWCAPVPYSELVDTLAHYDIGVHLLQPINFNHANALPNKVFDYVQARLGLLIGPSPEMQRLVETYRLGWVADDFSAEALARVIRSLDTAAVDAAKAAAHSAAYELASERQDDVWRDAIEHIVAARADAAGAGARR